jgi:hypothetical protein
LDQFARKIIKWHKKTFGNRVSEPSQALKRCNFKEKLKLDIVTEIDTKERNKHSNQSKEGIERDCLTNFYGNFGEECELR